jgi:class 3 adenylate cyclase/pimeloyl-ACP methyl ester carboxylesterase
MTPETHFAENDGVSIAYQVFGDGPQDLIYVPGWLSNLDLIWEEPRVARFLLSLAGFSRVIVIDRRGTGLSDRVAPPTLEVQMGDVTAVMDAVDSRRAALLGESEGGSMCALFAATHPERTTALVTVGGYAKWIKSEDYPCGAERDDAEQWFQKVDNEWGGPIAIEFTTPSLANDEKHRHWYAKYHRSSASKADAIALLRMGADIDLRAVLPTIRTPALVLQAKDDLTNSLESGRDFASRIPGSKLVEMEGKDHVPYGDCSKTIIREIQNFLGKEEKARVTDRVLTTVLFTDIVDSTQLANDLGDEKWSDLLEGHHEAVRRELEVFRGHEVKTTGDGFHATFDGPARAVQCANAIRQSMRQLGLSLRIGIHTGECEIRGDTLEGVAIHMAARVSAMAAGGDILVSRTVKDLVAGSGIEFEDFGMYELKGIPDEHQIFKVVAT